MKEDFLHYLWRYKAWDAANPFTTEQEPIQLIRSGNFNRNGGPDFLDARLRIDGTLWAGAVEMHLKSSDWFRHGHHLDPAYDNVILHVIWEQDDVPCRTDGSPIPQLILKPLVDPALLDRYHLLSGSAERLPCKPLWSPLPDVIIHGWLDRLLLERLEIKTDQIKEVWEEADRDWEEALYRLICRYLGGPVNAAPMEQLAKNIPLKVLWKYAGNRTRLEALLLGTAGLLPDTTTDPYEVELRQEACSLLQLHSITPLPGYLFRFLRMRPAAFPTLRIAFLAALADTETALFARWIREPVLSNPGVLLEKVKLSPYWQEHYRFGLKQRREMSGAGEELGKQLWLNVVLPMRYFYAFKLDMPELREQVLEEYRLLTPENNRITRVFQDAPLPNKDAADSQALYHLFRQYCRQRRCMDCQIAATLLNRNT